MAQSTETKLNKRFDQNIEITGTLTVNGTVADLSNYLTSFTETDPTVPSHVKSITITNISNWNTVYGWGNHAEANYLTSYTETDTLQSVTNRAATTTNNITLNGSALQFDTSGASTTTNAKIFFGTFPSPSGSLAAASSVDDYGVDTYGIILQSGYVNDVGGIKIADDGVVVWGAGDSDLFKVVDEDSNVDRFKIDNNGKGTFNYGLDVNGSITVSAPDAFILTNSGTGTYNKAVIYSDAGGFLLEGAKATDSNDAAKLPVTLTWRGNYNGNGGLKLTGDIKLYTDNTGLAINHTSPSYTLDVNGSFRSAGIWSTASAVTYWGSGASATAYGTLTWDTGYASIYANSGNVLKLGAGGTQGQIVVDTSGRVGIGTANPSNQFVIKNNTGVDMEFGSESDGAFIQAYNRTSSSYGYLRLITGGGTSGESVRINNSGYVGIGTTNPIAKLTLPLEEESNYKIAFKSAGTTHAGISTVDQSGAGLYVGANSYVNASGAVVPNDSDYPSFGMYLDGWSSDEIKFYTAATGTPTNKMSLTSNGVLVVGNGVRIGTTTNYTSQTLQVNGFIDQTDTSAAFRLYNGSTFVGGIGNGNWAYGATWNGYYSIYANSSKLLFNAGGGSTPTMALTDNRRLGVGTTSPNSQLHINESTANTNCAAIIQSASWDATLQLQNANGTWEILNDYTGLGTTGALAFYNSGYRMVIDNTGKVGIGTTSPSAKLEVVGEAWVGNGTDGIKLSYSGGNSTGIVDTGYTSTGLEFRVGNSEKMRIDSSGNVGINETNPQYALDVSGTAQVQGYLNTDDYIEKILGTAYFTHGTANLAVDVRFGNNSFWGYIELEITSTYSNQNSAGRLTATYAIGTNPNGNIYTNVKRINNAQGTIVDNIAFGDFGWDSANSTFRIPISHITSNGNSYTVKVRMFTHSGGAENAYDDITISGLYTLTALSKQYPYYGERLDIGDNTYNNQQYKLVLNNSASGTLSHVAYDTMLIQQSDAPTLRLYESGESLSTTLASDNGVSRLASSGKLALHAGGSSTAVAYNGMGGSQAVMILTNGFVGINQGNPSYQLDVQGGSGIAARFQTTNDITLQLESTNNWNGIRWKDSAGQDDIWFYGATKTWAFGGGGSTISGKKMHIHGGTSIGSGAGAVSTPTNGLYVEGGMQVGIGSYTGGQNTNQSIYIVSPAATEYFTMGYKQSARSGEVMHRNNNAGASSGFYIEAGAGEAGGICLDQDSVHVYGSSDTGATFRVIDKDADVVTFEMLQTSWNGVFRGDVIAYGSMSSISDKRIKENIEPYENVLDRLCTLGVYSYNKITAPKHKRDKKEIGVIAQEMQVAFPELVETEKVDKPEDANGLEEILTVDYEHLTAILLQSIKELTNKVEELENKLNGTERRN